MKVWVLEVLVMGKNWKEMWEKDDILYTKTQVKEEIARAREDGMPIRVTECTITKGEVIFNYATAKKKAKEPRAR